MSIFSRTQTQPDSRRSEKLAPNNGGNNNNNGSTPGVIEEDEVLHASIRTGSLAQVVVAIIAVIGLIYLLKLVMITTLTACLLAFSLEPLVTGCRRIGIPRAAGALIAVLLMLTIGAGLGYFFYDRAVDFTAQLPRYSGEVRGILGKLRAAKIAENTHAAVASSEDGAPPIPVQVQEAPSLMRLLSDGSHAIGDIALAISFVPFLVYFMLTWKDHVHLATVHLFPKEHRIAAHRTVAKISMMVRSFITANVVLGIVNAGISTIIFWLLGIPYFYFLGVISGFVSLIPYLGVFLALVPPLAGGIGVLNTKGFVVVLITVVALHTIALNFAYPKIVGKRLRLNPLAVALALLFWAWIWGAMGLIFAVPLVAATKIICDYIESLHGLGAWLGE